MKMLALSLALLAAAGPALAAGDNPSPALLAKIQLATQPIDGAGDGVSANVSKSRSDLSQQLQVQLNEANMAEKKQLRAVQRHQDAPAEDPNLRFRLQVRTSD